MLKPTPVKKNRQAAKSPRIEFTEPDLPIFRDFSAILTGFSPEQLEEKGMLETYYYTIMKEDDEDGEVKKFFLKAEAVLKKSDAEIKKIIPIEFLPDQKVGPLKPAGPIDLLPFHGLAQRIIMMWYTGNWTTMNGLKKEKKENEKEGRDPNTRNEFGRTAAVSAEAYKNGLIWTVAKTHPAGAKQPGYESWSIKPLQHWRTSP